VCLSCCGCWTFDLFARYVHIGIGRTVELCNRGNKCEGGGGGGEGAGVGKSHLTLADAAFIATMYKTYTSSIGAPIYIYKYIWGAGL